LSDTSEATAGSKLKNPLAVPVTAPAVTDKLTKRSENPAVWHATVVADVHEDVRQSGRAATLPIRSSPTDAVCSPTPKLSPDTVTDAYPL
jgi:hypothetical protein